MSSHSMTGLEIGIIVGTVVLFAILITSLLYCRSVENRRRVEPSPRRVEEGQQNDAGTRYWSVKDFMSFRRSMHGRKTDNHEMRTNQGSETDTPKTSVLRNSGYF